MKTKTNRLKDEDDTKTSRSDQEDCGDQQLLSCPGWGMVLWEANSKGSKCHRTMQLGSRGQHSGYVILDEQRVLAWGPSSTRGKTLLVLWGLRRRGHSRKAALQEQRDIERQQEPRLQPPPKWEEQWEHLCFVETRHSIDDCVVFDRLVFLSDHC